ncbi:MAG TPA: MCE family protein [Solirubrobacteraceae bacterium]|nr:MCE family protein [Solirubrobacteraceae bacterium]
MVTQAPKKMAVFAAIAFSLSCIGLIIFVWTQFGGTIPFAPQGYRVKALFSETGLLVPNADVRISGVNVGKVANVQPRGVDSLVTLNIDHQYAPIPTNTRAILREKTLLGEAYVALSTGTGTGSKLPDEGTIPNAQVDRTQQLDQVLASFNTPTQHNLQALLNGTGEALANRGQDLNDAFGNLDPAVTELAAIVGVLNEQQGNLRSVIANGSTVLNTLGDRSADLQSLITAGDQAFSATAVQSVALKDTVNDLPSFLTQLRTTLTGLNTTLGLAKPSLAALRPVAPLLTPALREVSNVTKPGLSLIHEAPALLRASKRALPAIADFANAFRPGVNALLPAAQQLIPVIDYMFVDRQSLVTAMANLAAGLQGVAAANGPGGSAHYLRALLSIGDESVFGQSVREPTNRNNTYFAPGELSDIGSGGLKSASCSNTSNAAQLPLPFGNVPCRVQPGFSWGNGVAFGYYPHLTAAPAKP